MERTTAALEQSEKNNEKLLEYSQQLTKEATEDEPADPYLGM